MVNGRTKAIIDEKRINAEAGMVFAMANNGKKLNSYLKALDVQESKIGKDEEELKVDKAYQEAVHKKQAADMTIYMASLRAPLPQNEEEKEESDE